MSAKGRALPSEPRCVKVVVGPLETNCYLLISLEDGRCACVDPGGEPERILDRARMEGAEIEVVLLTHGHADHASAALEISSSTGSPVLLHRADWPLVLDPLSHQPFGLGSLVRPFEPQGELKEGGTVKVGGVEIKVLHTPGHTPGSVCLLAGCLLLSGDTLFAGSVGRVDHPGGDFGLLLRSLREKIAPLPDETLVLPGHGPETTIGRERRENPFFIEATREGREGA